VDGEKAAPGRRYVVGKAPGLNQSGSHWALAATSARIAAYRRVSLPIRDSAQTPDAATHRIRKQNLRGERTKNACIAPRRSAVRIPPGPIDSEALQTDRLGF